MDVVSYAKSIKAKKRIQQLQNRLGMNGTEQGNDVRDVYESVKQRLETLEQKSPKMALYNRVSELETNTIINLNKHNLHVNSVLNQNKYQFMELMFDDFADDSGIDATKSISYVFDSVNRRIQIANGQTQAIVVTTAENTVNIPRMITVSQVFNKQAVVQKPIDLNNGTHVNTEIINGKIQLQFRHTEDQYVPSGIYETPVIDFGENTKQILKLQTSIYIPTASANQNKAEVYIYTSTSPDNQTFSDWQLLNPDGTIASPAGRYLRIKIELKAEREQELNQVNTSVEYDPSKVIVVTDNYTLKDQDRLLKLVYNILDTMPIEYDATKIQKGLDYYVLQGNVQ